MAIDCNDAGVRFRVAKANYPVPEGLATESFQKLMKLFGCNMNELGKTEDKPLMMVQVRILSKIVQLSSSGQWLA